MFKYLVPAFFLLAACTSAPPNKTPKKQNEKLELVQSLVLGDVKDQRYVSSASALVFYENQAYVIADDEGLLYSFDRTRRAEETYALSRIQLPSDPELRGRLKPDYEAMFKMQIDGADYLVVVPSGSKKSRINGSLFNLKKKSAQALDFGGLYGKLGTEMRYLNIEGAIERGEQILFFQRGNGEGAQSGLVTLDKKCFVQELKKRALTAACYLKFEPVFLGKVEETAVTFSDAHLNDAGIYFLASAEATATPEANGKTAGTLLGLLKLEASGKMVIDQIAWFDDEKFEGLEVVIEKGKTVFYLVNDPDDRKKTAQLLKYVL